MEGFPIRAPSAVVTLAQEDPIRCQSSYQGIQGTCAFFIREVLERATLDDHVKGPRAQCQIEQVTDNEPRTPCSFSLFRCKKPCQISRAEVPCLCKLHGYRRQIQSGHFESCFCKRTGFLRDTAASAQNGLETHFGHRPHRLGIARHHVVEAGPNAVGQKPVPITIPGRGIAHIARWQQPGEVIVRIVPTEQSLQGKPSHVHLKRRYVPCGCSPCYCCACAAF